MRNAGESMKVNHTHDTELLSWVASANLAGADFPIQNLPFGVVRRIGSSDGFGVAVAIGDYALDLRALKRSGALSSDPLDACQNSSLNSFMAQGSRAWSELRSDLSRLLARDARERASLETCLMPLSQLEYSLPAVIGDYTDFYTSMHHATNIGKLFRPDAPLLPNYQWVPIGYHARCSSIAVSGQEFHRPHGQLKLPENTKPIVEPCRRLDYELEVGIFVGAGNKIGQPVAIDQAEDHVFGLCLLNDWSARDIQAWEYQPLGPFLAKNFASTISPWIVTLEALAPFRSPFVRAQGYAEPLSYLSSDRNSSAGAVDMQLEVFIQTEQMARDGIPAQRLSTSNFTDSFWTVAQMLAHHTIGGCNMRPGDFFGSGTMSGSVEGSQGALIEITKGGSEPVSLSNGETRNFLEDGDSIIMRARCERAGTVGIGFGECSGTVLPALNQ